MSTKSFQITADQARQLGLVGIVDFELPEGKADVIEHMKRLMSRNPRYAIRKIGGKDVCTIFAEASQDRITSAKERARIEAKGLGGSPRNRRKEA